MATHLPGKSLGQRSLAGCSPRVAESDATKWLTVTAASAGHSGAFKLVSGSPSHFASLKRRSDIGSGRAARSNQCFPLLWVSPELDIQSLFKNRVDCSLLPLGNTEMSPTTLGWVVHGRTSIHRKYCMTQEITYQININTFLMIPFPYTLLSGRCLAAFLATSWLV